MASRVEGASVRRIEEGLRSAPPTEEPRPHREFVHIGPPVPAEVVHQRIRSAAVLPSVLAVRCERHGASVGQRCFDAGVCGDRVRRRSFDGAR